MLPNKVKVWTPLWRQSMTERHDMRWSDITISFSFSPQAYQVSSKVGFPSDDIL